MEYVPPAFEPPYRVMLFAAAAHGWYQAADDDERERILGRLTACFAEWEGARRAAPLLVSTTTTSSPDSRRRSTLDLRAVRGRQPQPGRRDDPTGARGGRRRSARPGRSAWRRASAGRSSSSIAERDVSAISPRPRTRRISARKGRAEGAPGRRRRDGRGRGRPRDHAGPPGARAGNDQRARLGLVLIRARRSGGAIFLARLDSYCYATENYNVASLKRAAEKLM